MSPFVLGDQVDAQTHVVRLAKWTHMASRTDKPLMKYKEGLTPRSCLHCLDLQR